MTVSRPTVRVFAGTDGAYYTPAQIRRRCRTDHWRFCLYERDSARIAFERPDRSLLVLMPVEPTDLPPWYELRSGRYVARAVDTRRNRSNLSPGTTVRAVQL